MLLSKQILKNSIKGLNVCMLAGIGTLLVTGGIMHNNLYASTTIPTNYDISEITSTLYRSVPAGYIKPSYKFEVDPNCTNTPSTNELSASEAAEIIAQEIYRYFKADISGKTLGLYYTPEIIDIDNHVLKPQWSGFLDLNSENYFHICIDSVTGEVTALSNNLLLPEHYISNPPKDANKLEKQIDDTAAELEKKLENVIKSDPKKIQDVQNVIAASGFIPETIKSVTFDYCRTAVDYQDKTKIGLTVQANFKVVTVSDKSYYAALCEDLTRVNGIGILMSNN